MGRVHPEVGCNVTFVSEHGVPHAALVTAVHGSRENFDQPAINICFISTDEAATDGYGRAVMRRSSIVHKTHQSAPGNYWAWFEEL
jgi:hypothetical protein